MNIIKMLTHLAENAHHQVLAAELLKDQPTEFQQAFLANDSVQLRSLIGGPSINFPDRDKVTTIER